MFGTRVPTRSLTPEYSGVQSSLARALSLSARALSNSDRALSESNRALSDSDRALSDSDRALSDSDRALSNSDWELSDSDWIKIFRNIDFERFFKSGFKSFSKIATRELSWTKLRPLPCCAV